MPKEIGLDELRALLESGQAQLIEVLPNAEYEEEHLPGALNISLRELNRTSASVLDPAQPVVVYCWDEA